MKVAVIDYGMGNVFNVERALQAIGCYVVITNDAKQIEEADAILLPGVGAFPQAMQSLEQTGLIPLLQKMATEKPFLGICLGMQLLFDSSTEGMPTKGLGLIPERSSGCERSVFHTWDGTQSSVMRMSILSTLTTP